MLPCKPDHGERNVQLGSLEVSMQMSGCEASGTLYAISHVKVESADQVIATQKAWRTAALANIQATTVQSQPIKLGKPTTGQPYPATAAMLSALGTQPDGKAVHARLAWVATGNDIYHVAVYGPQLDNERLETLFADLRPP